MRKLKASILALSVLFGAAVTADAFAQRAGRSGGGGSGGARHYHNGGHHHHGGVSVGFAFGSPFWYGYPSYWPYYYPYPAAYYPYPAAVGAPGYAAGPAAYVEQTQPPGAAAPTSGYWYYCNESQAYYPYVNQCAGPWERVAPQPPS